RADVPSAGAIGRGVVEVDRIRLGPRSAIGRHPQCHGVEADTAHHGAAVRVGGDADFSPVRVNHEGSPEPGRSNRTESPRRAWRTGDSRRTLRTGNALRTLRAVDALRTLRAGDAL